MEGMLCSWSIITDHILGLRSELEQYQTRQWVQEDKVIIFASPKESDRMSSMFPSVGARPMFGQQAMLVAACAWISTEC